ncbi:exported hypothetical protein [Azospirillaceae bacterium]
MRQTGLACAILGGVLFVPVPVLASGSGHGGDSKHEAPKHEAPAHDGAKPAESPKPKPKKPDKDKNCRWDRNIDLDIEGAHLTVTQTTLRALMRGERFEQDGYDLYGSAKMYSLRVRDKDGNWYTAGMTRLGDEREGCIFFLVGRLTPITGEPQLQ